VATAARAVDIDVEARVISASKDGDDPDLVQGTLKIRGWGTQSEACFYLPYEDPTYGEERGTKRRFETFSAGGEAIHFGGGSLKLKVQAPARLAEVDPPQVARVSLPGGWSDASELVVEFEARVPRLPSMSADDWFYDGFMPQPLRSCPSTGLDPEYYRTPLSARYKGKVQVPAGWQYVGPGTIEASSNVATFDQTSRLLAFALGRKLQHRRLQVGQTAVDVYFQSAGFDEMASTVERVLPRLVDQFGPYPFPSLKILETTELQKHGLPGVIAMNKPAQAVFSQAQSDWLHWREWILAVQLARQWYGGAIVAESPDDEWLIAGIADFATLEALATDPQIFNLFSARVDGTRLISFDYLQFAEVSASMVVTKAPFSVLTNADFSTKNRASHQHPLLYSKQVFAMRQLKAASDAEQFRTFLKSVTTDRLGGFMAPKDFMDQLVKQPSPFSVSHREALAGYLAQWWTSQGWPNFKLSNLSSVATEGASNGGFVSEVEAVQLGPVDYPPLIGVETTNGKTVYGRAARSKSGDSWTAVIRTDDEPTRAVVDPTREGFDADRFDNASDWPGVKFFPGTANTLADDSYTVGWFPYAFRRPGEPFSLGLQGALLKYVQNGLFIRVEAAPSADVGAVEARHTYQIPSMALNGLIGLKQNYDHEREAEASVTRFPLIDADVHVGFGVKVRHKERVGIEGSDHQTFGVGLALKPAARSRVCGYMFEGEIEHAPEALADGFSYERKSGIASVDCNITRRISLGLRGFAGALYAEGEPPEQALFKPTELKGAHLRVDVRGLSRVRKISSLGTDLFLPFYLPIPSDAMLLARQMRLRLFFDIGRSYDEDIDYRSHGAGFTLPFGGDLAGAGSLAFTRIAVLAILESRVGDDVKRKPSIVFDVTGEL